MANYLVTGGAGFIGSHLAEGLLRRGHRVRVADSLVTGKRSNLDHLSGIEFLEGDLAELDFARRAVEGCEFVLHQAAIPSVPRSVTDPITSNRANVDGTLNTLVASRDAGIRRLVFAASSSAYGDTPTLPKHEEMPTHPLSPYALQKVIGEQYLQLFTRLYGLETVSIRYFNVFGPRQDPSSPYSGVISVFATALLENRAPRIFGDGEQTRDFVYVDDAVDAFVRAADRGSGLLCNIGTGVETSVNELYQAMASSAGVTAAPNHAPERPGELARSALDRTRAGIHLGWEPWTDLRAGVDEVLRWFRASR